MMNEYIENNTPELYSIKIHDKIQKRIKKNRIT